jgi:hypothetical protein
MTWNYRIIAFPDHQAVHEVFYDDGRPVSYTERPATFVGDGDLEMVLRDVRRFPVLSSAVFDLPVSERPVCQENRDG